MRSRRLERSRGRLVLVVASVVSAASGCATSTSARFPSQSPAIKNFQFVAPGLYRGAQPDAEGIKDLKARGMKTILSLRVPDRVNAWEAKEAVESGLDFISLPLSNYDHPSNSDVREFLKVVTDPTRQPVFVHCRQGQLRTGAVIASYRVLEQGWRADQAYQEAKRYGFDDQYPWYLPLKWFVQELDTYAHRNMQHAAAPSDALSP